MLSCSVVSCVWLFAGSSCPWNFFRQEYKNTGVAISIILLNKKGEGTCKTDKILVEHLFFKKTALLRCYWYIKTIIFNVYTWCVWKQVYTCETIITINVINLSITYKNCPSSFYLLLFFPFVIGALNIKSTSAKFKYTIQHC